MNKRIRLRFFVRQMGQFEEYSPKLALKVKRFTYLCFLASAKVTLGADYRSGCTEVFCKKAILRNFAKFTGKHMCQIIFFNKVAGLSFLKKRLWHRCFSVNFAKFLRAAFLQNTSGRLLLRLQ